MDDDNGLFGIDWDGDGKVSSFDDFLTYDIMSEDENDKPTGSCLMYVLAIGAVGIGSLLKVSGLI